MTVYLVNGEERKPLNGEAKTNWIMPCKGRITSQYGNRMHPVLKRIIFHEGIDISVPKGTPVKAVADGTVVRKLWNSGYGRYIEIDHGGGLSSFYGHLNSYNVEINQKVKQGQIIAKSGNSAGIDKKTGKVLTTGAHLHLGAKKNGIRTNPLLYIK